MCLANIIVAVASVKGIEGITWSGARGLMSKLVKPEQQGSLRKALYFHKVLF